MRGSTGAMKFRLVICGLLLGMAGVLLFGTIHGIVIVPIWERVFRGLPFAIAVGLGVTWAYHEYRQSASHRSGLGAGLRFGALLWLAGLPAAALGNGMRLRPGQEPVHWWVDVGTVVLAAVGGAALLWVLTRKRRGAVAGAIALGVLFAYNGGPMPIEDSARAFGLVAGFFVIEAVGGAVLAFLYARLVSPQASIEGTAALASSE